MHLHFLYFYRYEVTNIVGVLANLNYQVVLNPSRADQSLRDALFAMPQELTG